MADRFKLNKKDLPDDLRYSRERLWAKEFPDGTVRIGVAIPGVQDDPPGVYFANMRDAGYIATGKKFGFLDLDSGRFDLVAPLSGRIARVNPALAEDPGLVAVDCFGDGWLCEVTRVLPEALRALLDRDDFFNWLRFEREARRLGIDPVIGATETWIAGEPWPHEIDFRFGGRCVLRSRPVREGRNATFTPQWAVGESWLVRAELERPSIRMVKDPPPERVVRTYRYTVVDEGADIRGETCWRVRVDEVEGAPPTHHMLLAIARGDFSLRMIEEVSNFDPTVRSRIPNDWGAEGYLELRQPRDLIVDLPLFPPEDRREKRTVTVGTEPEYTMEAQFPGPKVMTIVMDAKTSRGVAVRSEQRWERGLPWWRAAQRSADGRVLIKAELLAGTGTTATGRG